MITMLTLLFMILFFGIFGRLIGLAFSATWGLFKIFMYVIFLPVILIAMVLGGLMYLALPILFVVGIISLIARA